MIPINNKSFVIKILHQKNGKALYTDWMKSLDLTTRARIRARIIRFEDGHFGDYKAIGEGVLEARFFFGSGYRVYFSVQKTEIILLLCGGDKATQANDIARAKELLRNYLEDQNANKS